MWKPTHVQVTVQRTRGLMIKDKSGTNNAYIIIDLDEQHFHTNTKENKSDLLEWKQKTEFILPKQKSKAEVVLTVLHHNVGDMDEVLGKVNIPLNAIDVFELPVRWLKLKDEHGKEDKDRGEVEVKVDFIVKAGSLTDLCDTSTLKQETSFTQELQIGGSLTNVADLERNSWYMKLATNIGDKLKNRMVNENKDLTSEQSQNSCDKSTMASALNVTPEAETNNLHLKLDGKSPEGRLCSLNGGSVSARSAELSECARALEHLELEVSSHVKTDDSMPSTSKTDDTPDSAGVVKTNEDSGKKGWTVIEKELTVPLHTFFMPSPEEVTKLCRKSKEELLFIIMDLECRLVEEQRKNRDIKEYLDQLLSRIMETCPEILQIPHSP